MDNNLMVKNQLIHLMFGTLIFVVVASFAVLLDLLANFVASLGVSFFTHKCIEIFSHCMLIVDLALFTVYVCVSSKNLIKEMFK